MGDSLVFSRRQSFSGIVLLVLLTGILIAFQNCGGNIEANEDFSSLQLTPQPVILEDDNISDVEVPELEPAIYLQMSGGPGIQSGAKFFLVSDVEGSQLSFQWYHQPQGSSSVVALTHGTGQSLQVESASLADEGAYWVEVSSPLGGPFISNVIEIQLEGPTQPGPLDIEVVTQPASAAANSGTDATFTVEVTSESGTANYTWQRRFPSESTWTTLPNGSGYIGQGTNQLTVTSSQPNDVAFFRVQADNGMSGDQRQTTTSQEVLLSVVTQRMSNVSTDAANNEITLTFDVATVKPNGELSTPSDIRWERFDRRPGQNRWVRMQNSSGVNLRGTSQVVTGNPRYSAYRAFVTNIYGQNVSRRSDFDHSGWYSVPSTRINKVQYLWRIREAVAGSGEYEFDSSRTRIMRTGQVYTGGTKRWRWQRQRPSDTSFTGMVYANGNTITSQHLSVSHQGQYDLAQATEFRALLYDEFGMFDRANHDAAVRGGTVTQTSQSTARFGLNSSITIEFESDIFRNQDWRLSQLPIGVTYLWQREVSGSWGDLPDSIKNQRGIIISSNGNPNSSRYRVIVTTPNGSLAEIRKTHIFNVVSE